MPLFRIDWIAGAGELTCACFAVSAMGVSPEPLAATVATTPVAEPGETVMVRTTIALDKIVIDVGRLLKGEVDHQTRACAQPSTNSAELSVAQRVSVAPVISRLRESRLLAPATVRRS